MAPVWLISTIPQRLLPSPRPRRPVSGVRRTHGPPGPERALGIRGECRHRQGPFEATTAGSCSCSGLPTQRVREAGLRGLGPRRSPRPPPSTRDPSPSQMRSNRQRPDQSASRLSSSSTPARAHLHRGSRWNRPGCTADLRLGFRPSLSAALSRRVAGSRPQQAEGTGCCPARDISVHLVSD